MTIAENLADIKKGIPGDVKLVAVSKFHSEDAIKEAYNAGQLVFGESRMQEFMPKQAALPGDIEWHFIGHLQTNKVKSIIPCVHTIHSVDSLKLLAEIEKQATALNRPVNCLLEIHIAEEETKYGFTFENCRQLLRDGLRKKCIFANVAGLMGMATDTDDEEIVRLEFRKLRLFFEELKRDFFSDSDSFKEISMGMSHDYRIAIEEGSTMVRIGSAIFGNREY